MDYWPVLALLGILALWGAIALVPWYIALIVRRGRGAFVALPFAVVAGIVGGALTPALGGKDTFGFAISLIASLAASGTTMIAISTYRVRREGV